MGCVYKKVCISKRAVNFAKFFSYGNLLILTSIVLVLTQKLGEAQHLITHKFNNADTNKAKPLGHIITISSRIPSHQTLYGNFP